MVICNSNKSGRIYAVFLESFLSSMFLHSSRVQRMHETPEFSLVTLSLLYSQHECMEKTYIHNENNEQGTKIYVNEVFCLKGLMHMHGFCIYAEIKLVLSDN